MGEIQKQNKTLAFITPSPVVLSGTQIHTGQGWILAAVVGPDTSENQIIAAFGDAESDKYFETPNKDMIY